MSKDDFPTDPNAETVGLPTGDSGKGSVPEPGKFASMGMPSEIGRYKILSVIASGGMGVVYEAMQEAPRRRVALKVIKAGSASKMALHRFEFETQILAKLRHPNIAQIYEAGTWESEQGPAPFFAMEYIPGRQPIVSYAEKNDLSLKARLELFSKICDAVHHGHQKGVIHRDLKPDNILIDSSGEPKIIDFGVARATDSDLTVTTMQTTMGQLIGTLQYMSPEQCEADPDLIDTRSDVYALGVILFELLSGKLPYDLRRQAIHEAVRVIKEQRPDSMSTINMSLRGDVDTITMKALEKERDRRYQSAAEFASDIHHFLNSEPIIARPLSMSYQLTLFTKKYRRTCAAVLLLVASVVLGLIGTGWGMYQANLGWTEADLQLGRVQSRNVVIEDNVDKLIGLIHKQIRTLPNAAEIQRAMLDIARVGLNARKEGQEVPADRVDLAELLIRYGKSLMSISGGGYGDINIAEEKFLEAGKIIDSFDVQAIKDEELLKRVYTLKLIHPRYFVELAKFRAMEAVDENVRTRLLRKAIGLTKERAEKGRLHYETTGSLMGIMAQHAATVELGNLLIELDDREGSKAARSEALSLVEEIAPQNPSPNQNRSIAITVFNLAQVSEPNDAMKLLERAIRLIRTVVDAQPDYARRKRDLATMLALRGRIQIENKIDVAAGIADIEESASLFTGQVIVSPQDTATKQDFESNILQFLQVLTDAGKTALANKICIGAIDQIGYVASGEALVGRDDWIDILSRLRVKIEQIETASAPQ